MPFHWTRLSKTEQVFTHESEDGTIQHFAVERLFNYMNGSGYEIINVALERDFVSTILSKRGIEQHRLERLTAANLATPVLYLEGVSPGTHLLADGHHRYVAHAIIGSDYIPSYIAAPKLWRRFLVDGIPDDFAKAQLVGYSGID